MPDVNLPKLSDTMEEGTIVEWKKKTGDEVKAGDVLAEVESDKATFDLEAETGGVLSILVKQGVPAKIGAPIATIGEPSAAPAKEKAKTPPAAAKAKQAEAPPPAVEKEKPAAAASAPPPEEPAQDEKQETDERAPEAAVSSADGGQQVKASPLAKRIAAEMGVDIAALKGSGPEGRIVKEDVLAAAGGKTTGERRRPTPATPRPSGPDVEVIEPTRMQATIARRMTEAKSTVPEFTVTVEVRVDEFVAVINPPEAASRAVGAIKDVPVVEDGRSVPGKVMRMTLSVDHRVFYGATAAQFMAEVKRLIENPVTLVVPPAR